jgi:hypothetical protein
VIGELEHLFGDDGRVTEAFARDDQQRDETERDLRNLERHLLFAADLPLARKRLCDVIVDLLSQYPSGLEEGKLL